MDRIDFHGVKLAVGVHNAYRTRLKPRENKTITIAPDRIVRLNEDGIECWLDTHLAEIKIRKRMRSEPPPYHAFVFELPKRVLKRFPLLVAYDAHGKLTGVTVFRPAAGRKKPERAKAPEKTNLSPTSRTSREMGRAG